MTNSSLLLVFGCLFSSPTSPRGENTPPDTVEDNGCRERDGYEGTPWLDRTSEEKVEGGCMEGSVTTEEMVEETMEGCCTLGWTISLELTLFVIERDVWDEADEMSVVWSGDVTVPASSLTARAELAVVTFRALWGVCWVGDVDRFCDSKGAGFLGNFTVLLVARGENMLSGLDKATKQNQRF